MGKFLPRTPSRVIDLTLWVWVNTTSRYPWWGESVPHMFCASCGQFLLLFKKMRKKSHKWSYASETRKPRTPSWFHQLTPWIMEKNGETNKSKSLFKPHLDSCARAQGKIMRFVYSSSKWVPDRWAGQVWSEIWERYCVLGEIGPNFPRLSESCHLPLYQIPLKNPVVSFPFIKHVIPGFCCGLHNNLKANSTIIFRGLNVTFSDCVWVPLTPGSLLPVPE